MKIGQFTNSYVLLQLKLHYMKQKIAKNHHSNQLLPSNRYLEMSNEMDIFSSFSIVPTLLTSDVNESSYTTLLFSHI